MVEIMTYIDILLEDIKNWSDRTLTFIKMWIEQDEMF